MQIDTQYLLDQKVYWFSHLDNSIKEGSIIGINISIWKSNLTTVKYHLVSYQGDKKIVEELDEMEVFKSKEKLMVVGGINESPRKTNIRKQKKELVYFTKREFIFQKDFFEKYGFKEKDKIVVKVASNRKTKTFTIYFRKCEKYGMKSKDKYTCNYNYNISRYRIFASTITKKIKELGDFNYTIEDVDYVRSKGFKIIINY